MKIALPLSKSDEKSFSSISKEDDIIPRKPSKKKKKTQEHLVTAHQVTQDPDNMEKGDEIVSIIKGSKKQHYV